MCLCLCNVSLSLSLWCVFVFVMCLCYQTARWSYLMSWRTALLQKTKNDSILFSFFLLSTQFASQRNGILYLRQTMSLDSDWFFSKKIHRCFKFGISFLLLLRHILLLLLLFIILRLKLLLLLFIILRQMLSQKLQKVVQTCFPFNCFYFCTSFTYIMSIEALSWQMSSKSNIFLRCSPIDLQVYICVIGI